jgi:hypothetical protein
MRRQLNWATFKVKIIKISLQNDRARAFRMRGDEKE